MISVYEHRVVAFDEWQGIEAEILMKDEVLPVLLLPVGDFVFRRGVYDMQRRAASPTVPQKILRIAARGGADLHDDFRLQNLEERLDHCFPETLHSLVSLSVALSYSH